MTTPEFNEAFKLLIDEWKSISERVDKMDLFIKEQINNRTLTLEWLGNEHNKKLDHLTKSVDLLLRKENMGSSKIIKLIADYPEYNFNCSQLIAADSQDNIEPESTFEGGVSRPEFVNACERIMQKSKLNFLDVGCGSGALVFDFLSKGHFSVGIDGSDACKKFDQGYWNEIKHLHTCDITKPFLFATEQSNTIKFDVISMWEVFEHIPEVECENVLTNIKNNIADNGIFVGSISKLEYVNAKTGTPYHVTLKENDWWIDLFEKNGFEMMKSPFENYEYCRGVGGRYQDPHSYIDNPESGFYFVAKNKL